jgi:hypothetical protein
VRCWQIILLAWAALSIPAAIIVASLLRQPPDQLPPDRKEPQP